MKKNVIAAAVAAALIAPVAMAEVSISGGLQAELRNVGGDATGGLREGLYATDGGQVGGENSGNYGFLKFSASEDLGDGMKAIAMYNFNVNVGDSNAAGLGARDAYVGLSAGWGTVLAGTMNTPYKSSTVGWDPMLATSLQARGNGGMSDLHNSYASNALAYANTFGTVKVVAAVVLDEGNDPDDAEATNGEHAMSFSINAPVGPVELAVAHVTADKFSDISNLGLGGTAALLSNLADAVAGIGANAPAVSSLDDLSATKVGVKWVSGDLTVAGQYEMLKVEDIDPTVAYVTASYKMGNNTISVAGGQTDWDIDGMDNTTYMAVALNHAFSKNTSGFVGYRTTDAGDMPVATVSTGATPLVTAIDERGVENTISAGLRVAF